MISDPLITVVTVVLNDAIALEKTIQSVSEQEYDPLEYIIVDGGSTDDTFDLIKLNDQHISHWISEKDTGIYDAMNKGIRKAIGEWILFLNAGDVFTDSTVLKRIFKNEVEQADVIFGDSLADYTEFRVYRKAVLLTDIWKGMICSHQSILFRASLIKQTGYKAGYSIGADHELCIRLYKEQRHFFYFPMAISTFTTHGISNRHHIKSVYERYRIVKSKINLSLPQRLYYCNLLAGAALLQSGYKIFPPSFILWLIKQVNKNSVL